MYYAINQTTGRIASVGIYPDAGIEANGSEPFTIYDAFNWRYDFESNTWVFDPTQTNADFGDLDFAITVNCAQTNQLNI